MEVRTRRTTSYGTPQESITSRKAEHLMAAAEHYLQNQFPENDGEELPWRIDLVSICLSDREKQPRIDHIKYAVQG